MLRVVVFFVFRYQWALALMVASYLVRIGAPGWLVNLIAAIFGSGWAYTGMRWIGWHPRMVMEWYERQREITHGSL